MEAKKQLKLKGIDAQLMIDRLKEHLEKVQRDLRDKEVVHRQYEKEVARLSEAHDRAFRTETTPHGSSASPSKCRAAYASAPFGEGEKGVGVEGASEESAFNIEKVSLAARAKKAIASTVKTGMFKKKKIVRGGSVQRKQKAKK